MAYRKKVDDILSRHGDVRNNQDRKTIIHDAVARKEALVSVNGCLGTWTPADSTGRAPMDTLIVRRPDTDGNIDWDSPNNLPVDPETFDMLWADALSVLEKKKTIYITDRVVGADAAYALPVRTITDPLSRPCLR